MVFAFSWGYSARHLAKSKVSAVGREHDLGSLLVI
jgi:hypothetical protein